MRHYASATPLRIYGEDEPQQPRAKPARTRVVNTGGDVIAAYLDDVDRQVKAGVLRSVEHAGNLRRSLDYASSRRYVGFADVVGRRPLAALRQSDLEDWLELNPQWNSDETKRRNIAAALACFHWAEAEAELISRSPYRKTRRQKFKRVERRDATPDEAALIFKHAPECLRRLIWFVDLTGARTCEARAVLWTDIDWSGAVIVLDEHKTDRQLTDPEPRVVGLEEGVVAELRRWFEDRRLDRDANRILVNSRGLAWTRRALDAAFRKVRRKLKLPDDLVPYSFRHKFGTETAMLGMSDRETADLMGHADPRTTRRYTHTANKRKHIAGLASKRQRLRKEADERGREASSQ